MPLDARLRRQLAIALKFHFSHLHEFQIQSVSPNLIVLNQNMPVSSEMLFSLFKFATLHNIQYMYSIWLWLNGKNAFRLISQSKLIVCILYINCLNGMHWNSICIKTAFAESISYNSSIFTRWQSLWRIQNSPLLLSTPSAYYRIFVCLNLQSYIVQINCTDIKMFAHKTL